MKRDKNAQSVMEYLLLVTAVVVVLFAFVGPRLRPAVHQTLDDATSSIETTLAQVELNPSDLTIHPPELEEPPDEDTGPHNNTPPEDWEAFLPCNTGAAPVEIPFLGVDENGIPVFSDPNDYVGNYCAQNFSNPGYAGTLYFNEQGVLMIYTAQGTEEKFDWNSQHHIYQAYHRQRYGEHWDFGCGVGDHSPGFFSAFEEIFGREGNCQEVYDHYYGHTRTRLEGLTGDLAIYNGMTLLDAAGKKLAIEHYLVPGDPGYIGTPSDPGQFFKNWSREDWITFYESALRWGIDHLLPYTLQDIYDVFGEPE